MKLVLPPEISTLVLPEEQRSFFKNPLDVILDSEDKINQTLQEVKNADSIPIIISVGDVTTITLIEKNLIPDLAIVDCLVKRKKTNFPFFELFELIEAVNPAASITRDAWLSIRDSLKKTDNKIIIKITGEEDLLVLPAILEAPLNSKVLYGQPNEGLVVVTVTEETKFKVNSLIQKMVKVNED